MLSDLRAVRATVILGVILSAAAIVTGVLVMFVMKDTKILFFVAGGLDIAAGESCVIILFLLYILNCSNILVHK
jgi:hypothetical protein